MADKEEIVVLVTGHDRRQLVRDALMKLKPEFDARLKTANKIVVHPNLVSYRRAESNTHPDAVRGVLDHIGLVTNKLVTVGDAGVRNTTKAFAELKYRTLERSGNIRLLDLNGDETINSFAYTKKMQKRPIGFSRTIAESDFNAVVVPAKMHQYFGVTLSVKTQVVGSMVVPPNPLGQYFRWPWVLTGYGSGNHTLADVFAEHPAQLAVIDGTWAMEGNGPADGEALDLGWLIASFNPVQADALAAYLMGYDPHEIGYLHHLDGKGWGPIDHRQMKIDGPSPDDLRRDLQKPDTYPALLDWREKSAQNSRRPLVRLARRWFGQWLLRRR